MIEPFVLADFVFHGERYQIWNQNERLWLVHQNNEPGAEMPVWELATLLV